MYRSFFTQQIRTGIVILLVPPASFKALIKRVNLEAEEAKVHPHEVARLDYLDPQQALRLRALEHLHQHRHRASFFFVWPSPSRCIRAVIKETRTNCS